MPHASDDLGITMRILLTMLRCHSVFPGLSTISFPLSEMASFSQRTYTTLLPALHPVRH